MATCARCKTEETQLYVSGVPVCLKCSEARTTPRKPEQDVRAILLQEVLSATALSDEAAVEFEKVMTQIPSHIPHPDGGQRIMNASRKLTMARNEMAMAHHRLNNYLEKGAVPEDLKRTG